MSLGKVKMMSLRVRFEKSSFLCFCFRSLHKSHIWPKIFGAKMSKTQRCQRFSNPKTVQDV